MNTAGRDGPGLGASFSAPVQTRPKSHSASCQMGTGLSPGVMRPGRVPDQPLLSSTKGANGLEVYLCLPSVPPQACLGVRVTFTFTLFYCIHMWNVFIPEITNNNEFAVNLNEVPIYVNRNKCLHETFLWRSDACIRQLYRNVLWRPRLRPSSEAAIYLTDTSQTVPWIRIAY
jgi:hypothetical protein